MTEASLAMVANWLADRCIAVPASCMPWGMNLATSWAPWVFSDDMPRRCSAISAARSYWPFARASGISPSATRWSLDTFITLKRRIELMLALPMASLDSMAIHREIKDIGTR